jgi:diguanylate cyclase (GGDEF)-like protein/PAS domain S-box-containing protein
MREPTLAQVVGVLFVAGGVLGLVSLVLPHPAGGNDGALYVVDAVAFAAGGAYLAWAQRIPQWAIHATVAGASLLICSAIYLSGVASGLYATMFVWIALFTAYFFTRPVALLHLAWLLTCYAIVLALVEDAAGYAAFTRWLLTAIALTVASVLTCWLIARRRAAEVRSEHFFDLSRDMLCTANLDGYFLEVNDAWTEALGYTRDELLSRPYIERVHPDDVEQTNREAAGLFDGADSVEFENRYRARDGSWRWLRWNAALSRETGLVYARASDVTGQKEREAERDELVSELDSQARSDELTGLPNRRAFAEELQRELDRAARRNLDLCLALVDLDHFKRFNDRHGHPAGDRLLMETAMAWREVLRANDFLARYGGEEFIVVLPDCSLESAHHVIERLRAATPDQETCSAGIARWDHRETPGALIERADGALYAAKAEGRDRTKVVPSVSTAAGPRDRL